MDTITATVCAETTCMVMGGPHLLRLEEHVPEGPEALAPEGRVSDAAR